MLLVSSQTLSRCSQVLWHLTRQNDLIFSESNECSRRDTGMSPIDATCRWRANAFLATALSLAYEPFSVERLAQNR
jgi:hypothetical protein